MENKSIGTIKSAIIIAGVWFIGLLIEFVLVKINLVSIDVFSSGIAMFFGMILGFAALYFVNS